MVLNHSERTIAKEAGFMPVDALGFIPHASIGLMGIVAELFG